MAGFWLIHSHLDIHCQPSVLLFNDEYHHTLKSCPWCHVFYISSQQYFRGLVHGLQWLIGELRMLTHSDNMIRKYHLLRSTEFAYGKISCQLLYVYCNLKALNAFSDNKTASMPYLPILPSTFWYEMGNWMVFFVLFISDSSYWYWTAQVDLKQNCNFLIRFPRDFFVRDQYFC